MLNGAFHTNFENFPYLMMYDKKTRRHGNALNVIFSTHKEAQVVYMTSLRIVTGVLSLFLRFYSKAGCEKMSFCRFIASFEAMETSSKSLWIAVTSISHLDVCVFFCELINDGTTFIFVLWRTFTLRCVCVGGGCSSQSFLWRDGAYLKTFQGI